MLVNSILQLLGPKGVAVALCAPTGRTAKRLAESAGLETQDPSPGGSRPERGRVKRGEAHLLDCALLVVNECRMADVPLMHALLAALPDLAALMLVGDMDQLPSCAKALAPARSCRDHPQTWAVWPSDHLATM